MSEIGEKPMGEGMCQQHGNFVPCSLCASENEGKSEKDLEWEKTSREVDQIGDKLGRGVDDGIKETVIALTVNEYPTVQSCEGHLEEGGAPFPWIQVESEAPEGWEDDENKQQQWSEANAKERVRMTASLEEFYQDRAIDEDTQLTMVDQGVYDAFRLQSAGGAEMDSLPKETQAQNQEKYRNEMQDFSSFLKKKFNNNDTPPIESSVD